MKKILLSSALALLVSGCAVTDVAGIGAEILLPNSETATISQAKRQSGLKLVTELPEINQDYFRNNRDNIEKLLMDAEYYKVKGYMFSKLGLSLTQPIVQIDAQIAQIQQNRKYYQAPKTYTQCTRKADMYNGLGAYMGSQCYESVTLPHSELWRKQETQRAMAQFNRELVSLQQQRMELIKKAKSKGADNMLITASQDAGRQLAVVQQKLNMHCNYLLKAPQVTWLHIQNNEKYDKRINRFVVYSRTVSSITATKGKDNCTSSVYYGFSPHNGFVRGAISRFYNDYSQKLGIDMAAMTGLAREYGYKGYFGGVLKSVLG